MHGRESLTINCIAFPHVPLIPLFSGSKLMRHDCMTHTNGIYRYASFSFDLHEDGGQDHYHFLLHQRATKNYHDCLTNSLPLSFFCLCQLNRCDVMSKFQHNMQCRYVDILVKMEAAPCPPGCLSVCCVDCE